MGVCQKAYSKSCNGARRKKLRRKKNKKKHKEERKKKKRKKMKGNDLVAPKNCLPDEMFQEIFT